jgi:hypothetical protein
MSELTFHKGSIKVQCSSSTRRRSSSRRGRHDTTSSSCRDVWDRGRQHEFRMSNIQLRIYYDAAYHVLDEAVSYVNDFQPSALPLQSQASGQRSAPTAGEGPPTAIASPWAAAGLGLLDTQRARSSPYPKQNYF